MTESGTIAHTSRGDASFASALTDLAPSPDLRSTQAIANLDLVEKATLLTRIKLCPSTIMHTLCDSVRSWHYMLPEHWEPNTSNLIESICLSIRRCNKVIGTMKLLPMVQPTMNTGCYDPMTACFW